VDYEVSVAETEARSTGYMVSYPEFLFNYNYYCNSLSYSINSSQIKRLQTIQNALARAAEPF